MTVRTTVADGLNELQIALASDAAFESWYQRMVPRVFAYLMSRCANDVALAEDLSQQTFIAAIEQRARFDGRSDTVSWLCGIARHKLADHFRRVEREERRQRRIEIREIDMSRAAIRSGSLDDREAIAEAMRSLPATHRAVLAFVVLDDLPVVEAARLMRKSPAATQSLLHRARESFRRAYLAEADDD